MWCRFVPACTPYTRFLCVIPYLHNTLHPIRAGIVIGTHNGAIYNADYLFRRLGLPRYSEVDSELIFLLADRFAPEGPIDQEGLKEVPEGLILDRGTAEPLAATPAGSRRSAHRASAARPATGI